MNTIADLAIAASIHASSSPNRRLTADPRPCAVLVPSPDQRENRAAGVTRPLADSVAALDHFTAERSQRRSAFAERRQRGRHVRGQRLQALARSCDAEQG